MGPFEAVLNIKVEFRTQGVIVEASVLLSDISSSLILMDASKFIVRSKRLEQLQHELRHAVSR